MTNRCGGTHGGPWFHAVMRLQECERPHMELLCHHQENSIAFCKEIMQQRGISMCETEADCCGGMNETRDFGGRQAPQRHPGEWGKK